VVVHRLLAASLKLAPLPAKSRDRAALHGLADNLNERHRNAQFAGRASVELHTLIFFQKRTVVADARIIRVRRQGGAHGAVEHLLDACHESGHTAAFCVSQS
jgi:exosome complex exonuclease DIS3/RRP44